MAGRDSRELLKGLLQPPRLVAAQTSYSEPAVIRKDLNLEKKKSDSTAAKATPFSSQDIPQPFLNPAVMDRKVAQKRAAEAQSSSGTSSKR